MSLCYCSISDPAGVVGTFTQSKKKNSGQSSFLIHPLTAQGLSAVLISFVSFSRFIESRPGLRVIKKGGLYVKKKSGGKMKQNVLNGYTLIWCAHTMIFHFKSDSGRVNKKGTAMKTQQQQNVNRNVPT